MLSKKEHNLTAAALEQQKKRKDEEAAQIAQVRAEVEAKNAAIEANRIVMMEQWKIRSWLEGQAILKAQLEYLQDKKASPDVIEELQKTAATQGFGAAIANAITLGQELAVQQQAEKLPPSGTKVLAVPIKQDNPPNWLDNFLANRYTPVVSGAICVLATDAAFVLLATSVTPLAPATLTLVGISWGVGRIAALTSVISTGYQYNHGLHETTKFDTQIALITYGLGSVPTIEMAAMNHVGFLYTAYTTFWRNK